MHAFQRSHRVLIYDLRGHGQTGPSQATDYSVELFAEDLRALLEALELQAPLLCGLSLGGMIAQAYASRFPVAGLVLADTLASTGENRREALIRKLLYPRWLMALAIRSLDPDRFARLVLWLTRLAQGPDWLAADSRHYVRDCIRRMQPDEILKTLDAVYHFGPQALQQVAVQGLVLSGEREAGIVSRHAELITKRLPQARFERIPKAGHLSNLENPTEFNDRLRQFALQQSSQTRSPTRGG